MIWCSLSLAAFLLTGAPVILAGASSAPLPDTEAQLVARLEKEQDAIKKSKEETQLARIRLKKAIGAYNRGIIEQGAQHLSGYVSSIKDSWQALKSSGRNASRAPKGFKELDIELREDARLLEDLKRRVSYFDRDPIEKAAKEIDQVRTEVLQALFPAARAPEAAKPSPKPK